MSVTHPPRRRHRHQPRRHDLPAAQPARTSARTSTPWSAGWTSGRRCGPAPSYAIKHTTRCGRALVQGPRTTGSTSTRCTATRRPTALGLNEIGRVSLRTTAPLFFDEYRRNRTTGSFILVDEATNSTVGAGMILGPPTVPSRDAANVTWHAGDGRPRPSGRTRGRDGLAHRPVGLGQVDRRRRASSGCWSRPGRPAYLLDGDNLRHGLNGDLGFSRRRPRRERPPGRRGRPAVRRRRRRRPRPAHQPVPRRPRPGPRRRTTRPGCRSSRCSSTRRIEVCERARPEGPLRQGPGRRDHRLHRHRRPLRGARGRPSCVLTPADGDPAAQAAAVVALLATKA